MAVIYIFNNNTGQLEKYVRAGNEPMPYNIAGTLTVREFMGNFQLGWSDLFTMQAWNNLRSFYGKPIHVALAFTTMADEGCLADPQFYFGLGFSLQPVKPFSARDLEALHSAAVESGAFSFVAPLEANAQSVIVDKRYLPAGLYFTDGLPNLYRGRRCNQVMAVQSALNQFGFDLAVDGIFGAKTEAAVRQFQHNNFLTEDGIVTYLEWEAVLDTGCLPG